LSVPNKVQRPDVQALYEKLFASSPDAIVVVDREGRILEANPQVESLFGYASTELLGAPVEILVPERSRSVHANHRSDYNHQRHIRPMGTGLELYGRRKDGSEFPVDIMLSPVESAGGQLVLGVIRDITERKRAETELRQANSQLEARQREIEADLQLAARVQQSLAPANLTWGGLSVETFYQPARTIGGDFVLITEGADQLKIVICDVCGHGIGSALLANRIYAETLAQNELDAGLTALMRHLNRFVLRNLGSPEFYMTLAAARFRRDGRMLEFAGAGHPSPMIVAPSRLPRFLESQSAVLGLLEDAVRGEPVEVPLQPGDRVVIYTDGFIESFSAKEEMLGIEGFAEIVQAAAALPLPDMKQAIVDRVAAWRGGPPADDMSLIIVGVS
jgi:PAS domain S-box-containing protein